jgi:hypothetical protein
MVQKLKLDISKELSDPGSLWTPTSRSSVEQLWAVFDENPDAALDSLPRSQVGDLVRGSKRPAGAMVKAGPPLSKEEALKRFKARKAGALAHGGAGEAAAAQVTAVPTRPVGFDEKV